MVEFTVADCEQESAGSVRNLYERRMRRHIPATAMVPSVLLGMLLATTLVFPTTAQIDVEEEDNWVATFGRPALRALLSFDNDALPPAASLGNPVSIPYNSRTGLVADGPAQSPLQSLAAQAVQNSFVNSATTATQQAAQNALLPEECPIQLVDFNLLTPAMLEGCTGMSEADVKQAPFMTGSQLCKMLPTYEGLAFTTTMPDTLPWLVVDMIITNGYGGAYCALRGGQVTPQGGVNGSCTLLQTTWIKDPSLNMTNLATGPKVIRAVNNGTFTLRQLTAIVQAPGVIIHGIRADENIVSRPLKMIQGDGTTITKFNSTLWSNLLAVEFVPVQTPDAKAFISFQIFKMQVSFC
eukprot:jgi/Botrbrau1/16319/Bobra.0066s0087.1